MSEKYSHTVVGFDIFTPVWAMMGADWIYKVEHLREIPNALEQRAVDLQNEHRELLNHLGQVTHLSEEVVQRGHTQAFWKAGEKYNIDSVEAHFLLWAGAVIVERPLRLPFHARKKFLRLVYDHQSVRLANGLLAGVFAFGDRSEFSFVQFESVLLRLGSLTPCLATPLPEFLDHVWHLWLVATGTNILTVDGKKPNDYQRWLRRVVERTMRSLK